MRAFAEWLYGTGPSAAINSTLWLIRLLQATHLVTAGVAVGSGVMIALRAMGWQRADEPFEAVWKRFAPWLAGSLAVMIVTGIAQTIGDPVREFTATSYWVKLTLLLCGVLGTLSLARTARRAPAAAFSPAVKLIAAGLVLCWLALPPPRTARRAPAAAFSPAVKLIAAGLVLCWLALPPLGRMIGYDLAIWGSLSLRE